MLRPFSGRAGLLRQALGAGELLSNQVLAALCLFLTVSVMAPVWQQAWREGVVPYTEATSESNRPALEELRLRRSSDPRVHEPPDSRGRQYRRGVSAAGHQRPVATVHRRRSGLSRHRSRRCR
ncbi:MAG: hypothetical protein CM1200mP2_36820 [Planctomycetaceae bacterium]|nr:MAG: hypothetical protein CM1200mP2_36820 [Planctomycetaceae bacterium]